MSSILDALKKAERESSEGDGKGAPWPALPVNSPTDSTYRRRLYIPLGMILGICLIFSLYWLTRQSATDQETIASKPAIEPLAAQKTPSVAPPAPKTPPPAHQTVAAAQPSQPLASLPKNKPLPVETAEMPDPAPQKKPSSPPEHKPSQAFEAQPLPAAPPHPPPPVRRPPMETAKAPPLPEDAQQDASKVFRTDKRIDLQALVWAPEAADRFVVINNILLKEGGSIDAITVLRINPDDVLLSEGADQWHQEFKIR